MGTMRQPSPDQIRTLTGLYRAQRYADALKFARALCAECPEFDGGWNVRGAAARALGYAGEAAESFRRACQINPRYSGAPYNLGLVLQDEGQLIEAMAAYRRALDIDPDMAQAHNNLGSVLTRLGEIDAAILHLRRACVLRPDLAEVHNSLGNALKRAGLQTDAITAYRTAIEARPDFAKAHYNLGTIAQERGEDAVAIAAFRKALALDPDNALAKANLLYQLAQHCDWPAMDEFSDAIADLGVTGEGVPPWPFLALEDVPHRQLARAKSWADRNFKLAPGAMAGSADAGGKSAARVGERRLRLLYVSADFHDHPGARLLGGLLREHDRSRFEVHGFSIGAKRDDAYRRASEQSIEHFHDVAGWSDERIVTLARSLDFDIAIDRQGYTVDSRSGLFKQKLAPLQVTYLGYPSTLGTNFIDYLIADPHVIPDRHRAHYSEALIRLPYCYVPADNQLPIAKTPTRRADHGLPENALVLCCFNSNYKVTRREFDIWMRVLKQIKGSVLWLFQSNAHVQANLGKQARARAVDPARLIFARRIANPEHLERHRHADLFIDTFCMNAHTTANDALWAGLPVVTREGEQFAARVASSLLHAVGLPELVTHDDAEYKRLILRLAQDPAGLAAIRAKLAANRLSAPLFNTAMYTRHFEAGMEAALARYRQGLPPADITVPQ
ncbi:tetratricopeptide repeat protein [Qipengyuania sp. ASV99]|uniref:O-linked N-acetylglucosamine transferase, SPINDLY family protein n=1 Tax=Qipengyuania sp. ASV99 TaxID=3399681 RepID=UPI003A4C6C2E